MATNFVLKIVEIGLLTFVRRLGIQNGLQYRNFDFKRLHTMIWLHRVKIW